MLTDAEIAEIDQRIQRAGAANCWTGTAGTIAADARRLVRHIQEAAAMCNTNDTHLPALAPTGPHLVGPPCAPPPIHPDDAGYPADHILRGVAEMEGRRYLGDETEREDGPVPVPGEGMTAKFGTGAVRSDAVEEFRYDLVSPIGIREVARTCAEGAEKYDDFNWEKGMPVHDLLNHALAHIYQFLGGDRSEPHLPHAAWNLLAAIHSAELWPQLNDGTLRRPGCRHPSAPPPGV